MREILLSVCLLAALSFPCRCGPTPGGGPTPSGERIAFTRVADTNRNGYIDSKDTGEIYVMNANGSRQKNLTNNSAHDWDPSWSPDGRCIAFKSDRDDNAEIYAMNAGPSAGSGHSGSGLRNLTNNPARDVDPYWPPDGTRIAFGRGLEIYVMNADGSKVTCLTNNPAEDRYPSWSPDDTRITFDSDRDGNREIYVMNADPSAGSGHSGSGQTNLTNSPAPDAFPSWGP